VINDNFTSYLAKFPSYFTLLVKLGLSTGVTLFNTLDRGEPLNSEPRNLTSINYRSTVSLKMHFDILNCLGVCSRVWQTDGQTDGRTEPSLAIAR